MYKIYKSNENGTISEINKIENDCWIDMTAPTESEMQEICSRFNLESDYLLSALDEEERSRIEYDEDNDSTLIIVNSPIAEVEREHRIYDTLPLALIHTPTCVITVSSINNLILNNFRNGTAKTFFTYKKSRFILQILNKNAVLYLQYLRQIEKQSEKIETELHKSMKNKELIQLLDIEKSLVYFSTSLKSNEMVLRKLSKIKLMNKYEDDIELLEDTVIENEQAIEMAKIYSDILSGTMDAFASVISNNLNIVMKFLTSITIIMAVPTMVASFFGMNVPGIPLAKVPCGFILVVIISLVISSVAALFMYKKKMF